MAGEKLSRAGKDIKNQREKDTRDMLNREGPKILEIPENQRTEDQTKILDRWQRKNKAVQKAGTKRTAARQAERGEIKTLEGRIDTGYEQEGDADRLLNLRDQRDARRTQEKVWEDRSRGTANERSDTMRVLDEVAREHIGNMGPLQEPPPGQVRQIYGVPEPRGRGGNRSAAAHLAFGHGGSNAAADFAMPGGHGGVDSSGLLLPPMTGSRPGSAMGFGGGGVDSSGTHLAPMSRPGSAMGESRGLLPRVTVEGHQVDQSQFHSHSMRNSPAPPPLPAQSHYGGGGSGTTGRHPLSHDYRVEPEAALYDSTTPAPPRINTSVGGGGGQQDAAGSPMHLGSPLAHRPAPSRGRPNTIGSWLHNPEAYQIPAGPQQSTAPGGGGLQVPQQQQPAERSLSRRRRRESSSSPEASDYDEPDQSRQQHHHHHSHHDSHATAPATATTGSGRHKSSGGGGPSSSSHRGHRSSGGDPDRRSHKSRRSNDAAPTASRSGRHSGDPDNRGRRHGDGHHRRDRRAREPSVAPVAPVAPMGDDGSSWAGAPQHQHQQQQQRPGSPPKVIMGWMHDPKYKQHQPLRPDNPEVGRYHLTPQPESVGAPSPQPSPAAFLDDGSARIVPHQGQTGSQTYFHPNVDMGRDGVVEEDPAAMPSGGRKKKRADPFVPGDHLTSYEFTAGPSSYGGGGNMSFQHVDASKPGQISRTDGGRDDGRKSKTKVYGGGVGSVPAQEEDVIQSVLNRQKHPGATSVAYPTSTAPTSAPYVASNPYTTSAPVSAPAAQQQQPVTSSSSSSKQHKFQQADPGAGYEGSNFEPVHHAPVTDDSFREENPAGGSGEQQKTTKSSKKTADKGRDDGKKSSSSKNKNDKKSSGGGSSWSFFGGGSSGKPSSSSHGKKKDKDKDGEGGGGSSTKKHGKK